MKDLQLKDTTKEAWVFTYGYGHVDADGNSLHDFYTVIEGDFHEARTKMFGARGPKFSMQYDFNDEATSKMVRRFNLQQVSLEDARIVSYDAEFEQQWDNLPNRS